MSYLRFVLAGALVIACMHVRASADAMAGTWRGTLTSDDESAEVVVNFNADGYPI
jgi:hypothetical protein